MKWYFRYEEAGEYYVEGGFMKAIAVRLKPGRRGEKSPCLRVGDDSHRNPGNVLADGSSVADRERRMET